MAVACAHRSPGRALLPSALDRPPKAHPPGPLPTVRVGGAQGSRRPSSLLRLVRRPRPQPQVTPSSARPAPAAPRGLTTGPRSVATGREASPPLATRGLSPLQGGGGGGGWGPRRVPPLTGRVTFYLQSQYPCTTVRSGRPHGLCGEAPSWLHCNSTPPATPSGQVAATVATATPVRSGLPHGAWWWAALRVALVEDGRCPQPFEAAP